MFETKRSRKIITRDVFMKNKVKFSVHFIMFFQVLFLKKINKYVNKKAI